MVACHALPSYLPHKYCSTTIAIYSNKRIIMMMMIPLWIYFQSCQLIRLRVQIPLCDNLLFNIFNEGRTVGYIDNEEEDEDETCADCEKGGRDQRVAFPSGLSDPTHSLFLPLSLHLLANWNWITLLPDEDNRIGWYQFNSVLFCPTSLTHLVNQGYVNS